MAVGRIFIKKYVHLEKKNAIIVSKKCTSIRISEIPKVKRGQKWKRQLTSMETKSNKNDRKVCECTDEQENSN